MKAEKKRTLEEPDPMAYEITEKCLSCGSCEMDCPSDAIREEEIGYAVDEKSCTDCGICVMACPVEAVAGPH